jgi:hypothetical protein
MARKVIDIGAVGNDGTGDSIRDSFRKVNDNFRELYSSLGLGERLTFLGLSDTPDVDDYEGQENSILVVGVDQTSGEAGIKFRQIIPGQGIRLDFDNNPNEIEISSEFSAISADPNPQLGGNLSASSGGVFYKIFNLQNPEFNDDAANKGYVDTKIARAGVDAIDPATGLSNPAFGTMSGPLILARDPEADDDERYNGLIAATKRYVDNAGFGSSVNLYVATSGEDDRVGVPTSLQGRALAYAYRSLEAALKKAEEIMLESRIELGPYKKILTYKDGEEQCTLDDISESPISGAGFSGQVLMSVDTITIRNVGVNYRPGDILTISGGTFIEPARYEILSITEAGGVAAVRQLSSGVYTALPGSENISTTTNSDFGGLGGGFAVATFDLTYKVNNVQVISGGADYGLVSVRIIGGGGTGAFGTANIVGGSVESIVITDSGTGFTALPNVIVNLPRFLIKTEGFRTDFTGDVTTQTAAAIRTRDIREGLYLRGETSGALAQILAHDGSLDSLGNEIFDVDIQFGNFIEGEVISYGDISRFTQITVLVESGIYFENLPLKVPQNVSIVGDEFRRVIVRPKPGISSSPWAFTFFRRDLEIDGMQVVDRTFGYHYLENSAEPVYPLVNNKGSFGSAAQLLSLNRQFIQKEVIAWIADQKSKNIPPFDPSFQYNERLCERDVGLLIDAMVFDLKYGGSDRTISAALKYYASDSSLIAITDQLSQTVAAIRRINVLAQLVIRNVQIADIYQNSILQIVDGAFIAEPGTGGTSFNITSATNTDPVSITTSAPHNLTDGDQISVGDVQGMIELNGNTFFVAVLSSTTFTIFRNIGLTDSVNGIDFGVYTTGGFAVNQGGVIGALTDAIVDVIEDSGAVNRPKDNREMDMFLCNDAVRLQAISGQGHGGFMMVLDPTGQILAKSPYAQECSSFSKSIGTQRFAGGMFIDGFTGNLEFRLTGKAEINVSQMLTNRSYTIKTIGDTDFTLIGAESNTPGLVFISTAPGVGTGTVEDNSFLLVEGLRRLPQLPASFIVGDIVYRINYTRDFVFNVAGSTSSFVLDEGTPWPFKLFEYDEEIVRQDINLIIDGLFYDIIFGSNYNYRKAGLLYRRANRRQVIEEQLDLTISSLNFAHSLAVTFVDTSPNAQATITNSDREITDILRNGAVFASPLLIPSPPGIDPDNENAKNLLLANIEFVKNQAFEFIDSQIGDIVPPFASGFGFDFDLYSSNIERLIEAVAYDITYGGNSQSRDEALRYFDGGGDLIELQLDPNELDEYVAVITHVRNVVKQVVQNLDPSPLYEGISRTSGTPTSVAVANQIEDLIDITIDVLTNDINAAPAEILPDITAFSYDADRITAANNLLAEKDNIQDAVIEFINENANKYEVLMPGNRSMLGNDYTQINDMGYGIVTTNGGLCEAVSMFTYYCYISYYSINGGQIRSVSGSSAHGVYALVAEGADPLEVPTPVTTYFDFAQGATCFFPSGAFANIAGGLEIFVTNYTYEPLSNGELEVDHGLGAMFRYPITAVNRTEVPGVARLGLGSAEGLGQDGLAAVVPNGTKLTIRQNSTIVLTGDVVDVATRPSTGLILDETEENVYRILQFDNYEDSTGEKSVTISIGAPTTFFRTNHGLRPDYQISFLTTGSLPTGLETDTVYFILPDGLTNDSFRISTVRRGSPVITSGSQTGNQSYIVRRLALTTLRENYDYIDMTVWPEQPYRNSSSTCTVSIGNPAIITLTSHGFNVDDVIRFESTGTLPGGLSSARMYFVEAVLSPDTFRIKDTIDGTPLQTFGTQSGVQSVGLVVGLAGDSTIAVVPVGPVDERRVVQTKLVWIGEEYTITGYQGESITNEPYALLTLNRPLVNGVIFYNSLPTLKSAVAKNARGTLTIRISLTRVTGHDLLDIGTGSYADTNYPNEIFGAAVNPTNAANETEERSVGRVFYVTTDQFGNFSVGPFFRVDQGTGAVTFSATVALSNLDGIGFKRGVPISEFSVDSSFADNATDTVPTENATRIYIERRLGLTHSGTTVAPDRLIPITTGGFMALDGQLPMKGTMNLSNNPIINVTDPVDAQDAVNLRSLTFDNFQDTTVTAASSADLLTFTGTNRFAENATVIGDVTFTRTSPNTLDVQINSNTIVNADINASAAIVQSKLSMNAATTRANATGITQADRGLASFNSSEFDATNGWINVKNNGIVLGKIAQIATKRVLGNQDIVTGNITAVEFTTVVNDGGAVKKSQYSTTGFLRRTSPTFTSDTDYQVVEASAVYTGSTDDNKLVQRDASGNFATNSIDLRPRGTTRGRILLDSKELVTFETSGTGGVFQYRGFLGQVGIQIGDGSAALDKRTFYDNNAHVFRTQAGTANAPVTMGALTTASVASSGAISGTTITGSGLVTGTGFSTGAAGTAGTLTGTFTLAGGLTFSGTSGLTMGTGTINVENGTLRSRTLTTGASNTAGTVTGNWSLTSGSRFEATYADLAEYYEGDQGYEVGVVLIFGGEKEVTLSTKASDHRVAGVVSNTAAYTMNSSCQGQKVCVALQGRVPCRVVGHIEKGDLMVTSNIAGVAVAAKGPVQPGTIIGKALENYDSDHIGKIEIAVGRT